jgi:hypothetical protein
VFVPWGVMNWPSGVKTSLARRLPASGLLESASEKKRFIRSLVSGGMGVAGQAVDAVAVGIIGAVGRPGKEARGWEEQAG